MQHKNKITRALAQLFVGVASLVLFFVLSSIFSKSTFAAAPNCWNVSGPTSITLGQSATYSANFSSPDGALGALVGYGANGVWIGPWPPRYPGGTTYSGSWTITPTSVGQFNVACRVWNDSIQECDGPNGWGVPACASPNSNLILTVNPAPVAAVPTGLASACNPNNAVFAWNTSANATSYNLTTVVNRVQTTRSLNVTSFSLPIMSTSTINWWVTASNQYNTSGQATGATFTCSPPIVTPPPPPVSTPIKPAAPSNITNTASSATAAVVIKWSDTSNNETGFYIYDGNTLTGQVGAGVTTFTDNANCPAQNGHKYGVQSFNTAGSSALISASSALSCPAAPPPPAPAAPSTVTVSASTPTGAVTVKWKDNSTNETGFNIYDGSTLTGSVSANATTFTDNANCPSQNGKKYSVEAFSGSVKSAKAVSAALACPAATPAPVTIPTAPSNVAISASSSTGPVTVTWRDNSNNETGFNIYDGTTLTGTVSSGVVTFTDNANCPAQNGKKYSIESYNTAGKSAKAVSASLVCPTATASPAPAAPTAPSTVTVSAANATAPVIVNWKDNSNNETGFRIYDGSTLVGTVTSNKTTFTDSSTCPGQNGNKYSVEAINGTVASSKATSASLACPAATPAPPTVPLAPSNVTISVPTATSPVTVNWKDNSINETGFNIYDGTTKKGTVTSNKTTFTDTAACPAQNGKKYSVEAYNGSGNSSRVTSASIVCPAAPPPAAPSVPSNVRISSSGTGGSVQSVIVNWTNPSGTIQGAYIYETINGGNGVLAGQTSGTATTFTDNSPSCPVGASIQYQVQLFNAGGNSSKVTSNTILCPGSLPQPAPDASSGSLKPASGSVGNVTVNSLLPKTINLAGQVVLAPVGGQSSVAYIETQTTVLQPVPGLTQVEETPVQNADNYTIPLEWPGFTPPVTQVRVDYALIGVNGTVLYSNSVIYTQIGSGPAYKPPTNTPPGPMPPGTTSIKQIGQFKSIPTATNNFNDIKSLELNKDYWVRLSIAGDSVPPSAPAAGTSDIMLVLDITGSMDSKFYNDSSRTTSVTKLQGAKTALQTFVDNADPQDYLGFGTFRVCRDLYD